MSVAFDETNGALETSSWATSAAAPSDLWDAALDLMPSAAYVCDREGIVVKCNRRAVELWGRSPKLGDARERFCGSHRLYRPDGSLLPHAECPMVDVLRTGEPARDQEVVMERPDGSSFVALANIDPIRGEGGAVVGAINCFQDITAVKRLEDEKRKIHQALDAQERRSRELLDALPAAVYTTDAAGRITYCNRAAAELAGREPTLGSDEWCVTWRLFWPDGRPMPHDQCPMAVALKEDRPVRGEEAIAERPDGGRVPFIPYPMPLHDESGALVGAVNMLVDISERKQAERDLRRSEERFRAFVTTSSDVVYRMSADWSEMRRFDGKDFIADTHEPGRTWLEKHIHPDDRPRVMEAIGAAIRTKSNFQLEHRVLRGDGSFGWSLSRAIPILDDDGEILEWFGAASDVTSRKQQEEHRELLINELNHRVKNTLAMVQSMALQTLRNSRDTEQAREQFGARLIALSKAHDTLTRQNWEGASLAEVVDEAIGAYQAGPLDRFRVEGPRVWLSAKQALALSMALHELCTNAVKYGALSNETGFINIGWTVSGLNGARELQIRWSELGGPPVKRPAGRGFGSRLIERGLRQDLNGQVKLDFLSTGVTCSISAPLAREVTTSSSNWE